MNSTSKKFFSFLLVIISILAIYASFLRYQLLVHGDNFKNYFEKQNRKNLANQGTYELAQTINYILLSGNIQCAFATKDKVVFLNYNNNKCSESFFTRKVLIKNQDIQLEFFIQLPFSILRTYHIGFMVIVTLLIFILILLKRSVDQKIANTKRIEILRREQDAEKHELSLRISQQVAHDIRSPLAALDMVIDDLKELPEDSRELTLHAINRITSIANSLFLGENEPNEENQLCLITISVINIINEKIIEHQSLNKVKINFINNTAKNDFVLINENDLLRAVSNIINNAIEALNKNGCVTTELSTFSNEFVIKISDNGKGFPTSILETGIIRGNTMGKPKGHGLGLYQALEMTKNANGRIELYNLKKGGACVQISLPLSAPPKWFHNSLKLSNASEILVIDDDISIHALWKKRLKKLRPSLLIRDIYTSVEIGECLNTVGEDTFVLIDYDLRQEMNGIDYIDQFNLTNVALVTSNYNQRDIKDFCLERNIPLIPKQLLSTVELT